MNKMAKELTNGDIIITPTEELHIKRVKVGETLVIVVTPDGRRVQYNPTDKLEVD